MPYTSLRHYAFADIARSRYLRYYATILRHTYAGAHFAYIRLFFLFYYYAMIRAAAAIIRYYEVAAIAIALYYCRLLFHYLRHYITLLLRHYAIITLFLFRVYYAIRYDIDTLHIHIHTYAIITLRYYYISLISSFFDAIITLPLPLLDIIAIWPALLDAIIFAAFFDTPHIDTIEMFTPPLAYYLFHYLRRCQYDIITLLFRVR